jgi:hypothetical protein
MIVWLFLHNLWRHIKRCPFQRGENLCFVTHGSRKSEIAQLYYTVTCHQNVLGLHVSVRDSVGMNIMQSPNQLLGDFSDFLDLKALIIFNYIEKLSLSQFSDQNELALGFKGIK